MKYDRLKNSKRNMFYGVVYRFCLTVLPFINRTVLINVLGAEYLGLNSLFTSVLNILNLAELGFGSAVVYSMYKPIADNNQELICALLNFYKRVYRIIGYAIFVFGCIALAFIDKIIAGDVPSGINLPIIFFIQLLNVVFSYFFLAYKTSVLSAYQREDVISKISTVTMVLQYVVQFSIVFITKNYYLYLIVLPVSTILNNVLKVVAVKRLYPEVRCRGSISKDTRSEIMVKVKALLLHKIGGVIANSLDNIVISSFMGLVAIAVYNNYWYVYSSVCYFIAIFHSSIVAGLGNSIALETREQNYEKFRKLNFINSWIVGWCSCCMMCMYQPFMKIWVGQDYMYPLYMVILFVFYFYINMARRTIITFKDAAGIWVEDRFKPIVSAAVNIVLNIILIQLIGIAGVVISTIISFMVVEIPWETEVLFKNYFRISSAKYYAEQIGYCTLWCGIITLTYFLCGLTPGNDWFRFILSGGICLLIPNVFIVVIYRKKMGFVLSYLKGKKE